MPEGYEIIARVLEHLGESQLLSTFEADQIDDATLPTLEPADLLNLGVSQATCEIILGSAAAAPGKVIVDRETYEEQRREIPDEYTCPISTEPMEDPVMAADGHSYERREIDTGTTPAPVARARYPKKATARILERIGPFGRVGRCLKIMSAIHP